MQSAVSLVYNEETATRLYFQSFKNPISNSSNKTDTENFVAPPVILLSHTFRTHRYCFGILPAYSGTSNIKTLRLLGPPFDSSAPVVASNFRYNGALASPKGSRLPTTPLLIASATPQQTAKSLFLTEAFRYSVIESACSQTTWYPSLLKFFVPQYDSRNTSSASPFACLALCSTLPKQ